MSALLGSCRGVVGISGDSELWPDQVPVIGAEVLARDSSRRQTLNGCAETDWNWSSTVPPLLDHGRGNAELSGQIGLTPGLLAGSFNGKFCAHRFTLALLQPIIKPRLIHVSIASLHEQRSNTPS